MWWRFNPAGSPQRLGLEAHGSDLNPVAVLITKTMIEIPPRFAGQPPVNSDAQSTLGKGDTWIGAAGLACEFRKMSDINKDNRNCFHIIHSA